MKRKKLLAALLATAMIATTLTGCGDAKTTAGKDSNAGSSAANSTGEATGSYDEMLTFDIYDGAANYQGVQTGWYARL